MRKYRTPFLSELFPEEPLVNLTPLIDVVFVVLITFILISPTLEIDSVVLAASKIEQTKETFFRETSPLSVAIHADNTIWFQGKMIKIAALQKALLLEKEKYPDTTPQLIPDARSHFETYQQVKNVLEGCGFEKLDIILRPE